MYYFGVNLESRFQVPDFWPALGTTHRLPFDREELKELSEKLKKDRLERKRRRLEREGVLGGAEEERGAGEEPRGGQGEVGGRGPPVAESSGTFGVGSIERWARGGRRD